MKNNPKRGDYMRPIIKTNAWYTLVTAKNEVINASWCKQQLAKILKKSTDTIILFDVTGNYAVLVLDHDRLIPGQVPMAIKQYKSTPEGFILAHTVKVDVEDSQEPRLLVFDLTPPTISIVGGVKQRTRRHSGAAVTCWSETARSSATSAARWMRRWKWLRLSTTEEKKKCRHNPPAKIYAVHLFGWTAFCFVNTAIQWRSEPILLAV